MSFLNLNLHFESVASFAAWLDVLPPPRWSPVGSTVHNTYVPDKVTWRGAASMASMQQTYIAKGWSTGPHAYLATGTAADGIWVMCPPTQPGVHGVSCNATHFGLEVVGDFDKAPMPPADLALLVDVAAALHRWARIGPDVNAHRDCIARTCPGDAAYAQMPAIRSRLAAALATPPSPTIPGPRQGERYRVDVDFADFWSRQNGLWNFGFALADQRTWSGRPVVICERAVLSQEPDSGLVRPLLWEDAQAARQSTTPPAPPAPDRAYTVDSPLLASAGATPGQATRYLRRHGPPGAYTAEDVEAIVNGYWRTCAPVGLDPIVAVAQLAHETGSLTSWWSQPPRCNPAGIGVTGARGAGVSFGAWDQAIPAHVGRLLAYALTDKVATPEQRSLIATALRWRPLPLRYRGCAPTLVGLEGTWAVPGDQYADALARHAQAIVEA